MLKQAEKGVRKEAGFVLSYEYSPLYPCTVAMCSFKVKYVCGKGSMRKLHNQEAT
jgi:hypothetical protein